MEFFKDKEGKIVVWQAPNPLLWAWIIMATANLLLRSAALDYLENVVILIWAYGEITAGDSPFRRVLGVVVGLAAILPHLH